MSIAELHPEELFDKLAEGAISVAEQDRLAQHLKVCAVCRFEYGARLDFTREAAAVEQRIAPSLPLLPAPRAPLPRPRRRSRVLVVGIAAAVLISASGALAAALGAKPWRAITAIFVSAPEHVGERATKTRVPDKARAATLPQVPSPSAPSPLPPSQPAASLSIAALPRAPSPLTKTARRSSGAVIATAPSTARVETTNAPTPSNAAAPEPSGAAKLFAEANQARRAGQVGRASGLYHLLQDQYPGSSEAELSRVTLATLLLNGGDAGGALAGFERYLAGPSRVLEAEALVGRARALERLGRKQPGATAWREVQRRFPGSVYARQAAERLTALEQP